MGTITSRCSGKWARAHPPVKTGLERSAEIDPMRTGMVWFRPSFQKIGSPCFGSAWVEVKKLLKPRMTSQAIKLSPKCNVCSTTTAFIPLALKKILQNYKITRALYQPAISFHIRVEYCCFLILNLTILVWLNISLQKLNLIFVSLKNLWMKNSSCDHSNESYSAVLSFGAVYYAEQGSAKLY